MKKLLLTLLSAVLLYASFPPLNLWFLAWIALVPLFVLCRNLQGRGVIFHFWLHSFCFYFLGLFWITTVSFLGLVVVTLILSLYGLLLGWLVQLYNKRLGLSLAMGIVVAWISVDYLRSLLFTGFPWLFLGHSQYRFIPLIQIADLTGVYGITFLILLVNENIASLVSWRFQGKPARKRVFAYGVTFFLLAGTFAYGLMRMMGEFQEGPRISAVQGNIPLEVKMQPMHAEEILERHRRLTWQALEKEEFDLLVWSETMYPFPIWEGLDSPEINSNLQWLQDFVRITVQKPFITGVQYYVMEEERRHREYNSGLYFSEKGEVIGRYDKIHLVPAGEYLPLKELIPFVEFVESVVTQQAGYLPDVTPGEGGAIFSLSSRQGDAKFGLLICYENIFPHLVRDSVQRGAQFIMNISNDGWFKDSAELDQVLAITAFRAVENRITLFRATNTGITALIDPNGKIRSTLKVNGKEKEVAGVFSSPVLLDGRKTFYTSFGDVFAGLFLLLNAGMAAGAAFSGKKVSGTFSRLWAGKGS